MKLEYLHMHFEARDIKLAYCDGFDQDLNDFKHAIYINSKGKAVTILKKEHLSPEYIALICENLEVDVPIIVQELLNK